MSHVGVSWSRILVHVGACIGRMAFFGFFFGGRKNRNGNHGCRFSKKGMQEERMKRMWRDSIMEDNPCWGRRQIRILDFCVLNVELGIFRNFSVISASKCSFLHLSAGCRRLCGEKEKPLITEWLSTAYWVQYWWAIRDLNPWHSRCKRDALTNWANRPK